MEPTYYGQKVYSDKVVFVIDLSLSMNEEMVVDREMIVRETGAGLSSTSSASGCWREITAGRPGGNMRVTMHPILCEASACRADCAGRSALCWQCSR